jgi:hypothetical protein
MGRMTGKGSTAVHPVSCGNRQQWAETTVTDWSERLVCWRSGSRNVNMLVSGAKPRYGQVLLPS